MCLCGYNCHGVALFSLFLVCCLFGSDRERSLLLQEAEKKRNLITQLKDGMERARAVSLHNKKPPSHLFSYCSAVAVAERRGTAGERSRHGNDGSSESTRPREHNQGESTEARGQVHICVAYFAFLLVLLCILTMSAQRVNGGALPAVVTAD